MHLPLLIQAAAVVHRRLIIALILESDVMNFIFRSLYFDVPIFASIIYSIYLPKVRIIVLLCLFLSQFPVLSAYVI